MTERRVELLWRCELLHRGLRRRARAYCIRFDLCDRRRLRCELYPRGGVAKRFAVLAYRYMHPAKVHPWVLLVDDHDDGRELLGEFLSCSGYGVEGCSSGEDALMRVAEVGIPDAVITDLSLGQMSGTELARELRRRTATASVPIVLVTGHASFNDPEHLFAAVLVKPIALPSLTAELERAMAPFDTRPR